MTEQQLRQQVADVMTSWLGAARGSATHLEILRIYNNHRPLARGYTVQVGDAYCATTTAAAYIKAGIADYTGTECGCDKFIAIAQQKGIWVEDDAHVPKIGEACFYDWDDSGSGDNRGSADHVGIVVRSGGGTFDVIEGNGSGGKVVKRTMNVNGKYIRGFLCPDFAKIAKTMSGEEETELSEEAIKKLIDQAAKSTLEAVDKRIDAAVSSVNTGVDKKIDTALSTAAKTADKKIKAALDALPGPTTDEIMAATNDRWIGKYADLPNWAKKEVRELIEMGALKGTKPAESVEDVSIDGSLNNLVRPMIIAYRAVKEMLGTAPKEAVAELLKRMLAGICEEE